MKTESRRNFLKAAAVSTAALSTLGAVASPTLMAETAKGANDRIGVGFIGTGGRCGGHIGIINEFTKQGITQPIAVCDVYRPRMVAASEAAGGAKMYDAHEELLADKNVDVVCIATPDAHHAQMTIDAFNAGKDVYCEKPLTHWSQFEKAKEIAAAADKTKRIVQVGTQYMIFRK
ncbi:MAG: Gfo/Idh/MocA family oxidoreductase [Thermoguttaceae bacterium]